VTWGPKDEVLGKVLRQPAAPAAPLRVVAERPGGVS
jgi:hypothetical protein